MFRRCHNPNRGDKMEAKWTIFFIRSFLHLSIIIMYAQCLVVWLDIIKNRESSKGNANLSFHSLDYSCMCESTTETNILYGLCDGCFLSCIPFSIPDKKIYNVAKCIWIILIMSCHDRLVSLNGHTEVSQKSSLSPFFSQQNRLQSLTADGLLALFTDLTRPHSGSQASDNLYLHDTANVP